MHYYGMAHRQNNSRNPAGHNDTESAMLAGKVADMVAGGQTLEAMKLSGQAFRLSGYVVEGNKIGRTLGYPTANLNPPSSDAILPGQGVYTALVQLDDKWFDSMVNIGIRPTLNLHQVTIEAHLFDFRENIYGKTIAIHFLEKIRDEMRFSSLSELKEQLHADKQRARKSIASLRSRMQHRGDVLQFGNGSK